MRRQRVRDRNRIALVHLHARVQAAHAAQRQETVERRAGHAQAVRPPRQLLVQRRVLGDHGAADHVAVAIQVLGRGMDHHIRAQRERLLPHRRQERVVDDDKRADAVRECRGLPDVGDPQQRIGRRLEPNELRSRLERARERRQVGRVDELDLEPAGALQREEQPVAAAVAVARGEHEFTRRHETEHERDRGHARGGHDAASAALEAGERLGERVARRIAGTAIVVLALHAEGFERIGRAQVQRRHHRAVLLVGVDAGAYRQRARIHAAGSHRAHRGAQRVGRQGHAAYCAQKEIKVTTIMQTPGPCAPPVT